MRFGVLGSLAVWTDDGGEVTVPGVKVRALLADLLTHEGRVASVDRLVEDVWGDDAPANPGAALQVRVSQLRKALDDAEPGARDLVVSRAPGYALEADAVDAREFAALIAEAQATQDPRHRKDRLTAALALWRGPALADFADHEFARAVAARWEEQRLAAVELLAEARLELGEHTVLAAELTEAVEAHPFRERLRAVHLRALYRAGRQREALDRYEGFRRGLADELGLDPGPDLAALHQAILEQDPSLTPSSIRTAHRPTTNLTAPPPLIGREAALADLRDLIGKERLVTLTGPGGVGKTRLATAAAHGLVGGYADGGWLVELAALERPQPRRAVDDIAELATAALGIRDAAEPGDRPTTPADRLADALRERRVLLVLDNCEHLVEPAAALTDRLLRTAPGLTVLATSREPLGLSGEVLWEVPPLDLPAVDADDDGDRLASSAAVRLFVTRAAASARGFTLDASTGPAVAQLCRRLDGIPLALELAATRVRALGVHTLLDRLDDRFRALGSGPRDRPARQRTLTAAIDWSWNLLDPEEQVVLRRLAVHADGCTLAAAEAVSGDDGVDVLDVLARLVDRSLVVMDERDGGPRYRLLESVAAYCVNRLHEAGEHATVRARHARYYTDLAREADTMLRGAGQREWLRTLDAESANVRAALDTAERLGDAELALRLTSAMTWYWLLRGRLTEGRRALETALTIDGDAPAAVRGAALSWHTGIAILQGDQRDWTARCEAALAAFDGAGVAPHAEWFLCWATFDLGDAAFTERLLDRAATGFAAAGDRWGEAAVLTLRARVAHVHGDPQALERNAEAAVRIFRELGDGWGILQATDWLVGLADLTGRYDEGLRLCRESLPLAEGLGLWPDVVGSLSWQGWIGAQTGDYAAAREHCERALRLAAEHGLHSAQVFAALGLSFATRRAGDLDVAEEQLNRLLRTAEQQTAEAGTAFYLSIVLNELGFLTAERGDAATALDLHLRAYDAGNQFENGRELTFALEAAAAALAQSGEPQAATVVLGAAETARSAAGLPLAPAEQREADRIVALIRSVQDGDAFDAAYAEGAGLTPAAARELAGRPRTGGHLGA